MSKRIPKTHTMMNMYEIELDILNVLYNLKIVEVRNKETPWVDIMVRAMSLKEDCRRYRYNHPTITKNVLKEYV